ncbi:MAG: DUF6015 family protein [Candidatus Aenigmatarchaeota archaeon]
MALKIEELGDAIRYMNQDQSSRFNLNEDEADYLAEHALNFFGFEERIIDNTLNQQDRDVFYTLEDMRLLKTEREEVRLYNGKEWRIHYWTLKEERIKDLAENFEEEFHEEGESESASIYDDDEMWNRIEKIKSEGL